MLNIFQTVNLDELHMIQLFDIEYHYNNKEKFLEFFDIFTEFFNSFTVQKCKNSN